MPEGSGRCERVMEKRLFLGKRYLLLGAVTSALLIFLSYWMRLAFIYGNLALLPEADWTESTRSLDMVLPVLPGVVLLFIGIKAVNVSVYADRQAGWNSYLLASPLGRGSSWQVSIWNLWRWSLRCWR